MTKEKGEGVAVAEKEDNSAAVTLNMNELAGRLDNMEEGVKLTGKYFKPEGGEITKCWLIGKTTMNSIENPDQKVPAVRLLLEDEEVVITASAVIVGTCSDLPIPTALRIVKTGERDMGKGKKLSEFDIHTLQNKQ